MSFKFVENPIRLRTFAIARIAFWGVATTSFVVALGVILSVFGSRLIPELQDIRDQRAAPVASFEADCFLLSEFESTMMSDCWFRTSSGNGWVLLAGDSHAAHVSNAVFSEAHLLSRDVFSLTGGVCPFLDSPSGASDVPNCDSMNEAIWDLITGDNPPDAVILSEKGFPEGLSQTVARLQEMEVPVIIVRDVPRWAPLDRRLQDIPCTGGALTFTCSFDQAVINEYSEQTRSAEEKFLRETSSLIVVDPWPVFCEEALCSPIVEGSLLYLDNEHLNGIGSGKLAPLVKVALTKALV